MRNIAILCLLLACALPALAGTYRADEIPNVQRMDRRRYVSDPDGILSPAAVAHIDSVCASLRERGLAQVAVVAVDDIAGGDTFSFAVDLFRSWGVGSAKSNNGLGILLVKDLREIRFVTGGGLEGILPDALCKRIQLNYMLPAFREGGYSPSRKKSGKSRCSDADGKKKIASRPAAVDAGIAVSAGRFCADGVFCALSAGSEYLDQLYRL